ncbi:MAG: hypothetical protein HC846_02750 [Blastocatellia bacterium]|nr:hypothetical protein [Blastocatellia bacterium]
MRLAVISHKLCWKTKESPSGYATDGGFPLQMKAISELFSATCLVIPCEFSIAPNGLTALDGNNLKVTNLSIPKGSGWRRKIGMLPWLLKNSAIIWREIRRADAVHTPIPGDVGTIGMLFAMLLKNLFSSGIAGIGWCKRRQPSGFGVGVWKSLPAAEM